VGSIRLGPKPSLTSAHTEQALNVARETLRVGHMSRMRWHGRPCIRPSPNVLRLEGAGEDAGPSDLLPRPQRGCSCLELTKEAT
jgi:hypothetical protein